MPDVAIFKPLQFDRLMSEAKTTISKETLIPLSLVSTFVLMIAGGIIAFTTHSNQLEMLTLQNAELKAELAKMQTRFISKEMFDIRFDRMEKDISEIKEMLKSKQ